MKKIITLFIITGFFICFNSNSVLAKDTLVIGLSEYPPYYFTEGSGTWTGLSLEVLQKIAKKAGIHLQITPVPWSRAMKYIKTGEIDLMLNVTRTKERKKFMDFIGMCSYEQMVLIIKKENIHMNIKPLDDFSKYSTQKKFSLQKDYHYPQITERLKNDKSFKKNFEFSVNSELNIRKRLGNRIMGFFDAKFFAFYATKLDPKYKDLRVHSFYLNAPQPVHIGASLKTNIKIRNRLKKAYKILTKKGVINSIIEKWAQ